MDRWSAHSWVTLSPVISYDTNIFISRYAYRWGYLWRALAGGCWFPTTIISSAGPPDPIRPKGRIRLQWRSVICFQLIDETLSSLAKEQLRNSSITFETEGTHVNALLANAGLLVLVGFMHAALEAHGARKRIFS